MAVTIREVANRAKVSTMTVSRVLNASHQVQPETRRKVEQAIQDLGYIPNGLARGLSIQKTGIVAIIVPDVANPFFTRIIRGAENVAWENGYRTILCNTENDLTREKAYLNELMRQRVEGLVIAPTSDKSKRPLSLLEKHKVPIVLVDRALENVNYDIVQGDNQHGAFQLVRHLTQLGHKRIAMLSGPLDISTSRDRFKGYQQALEEADLAYDPELVIQTEVDIKGGYRAGQKIALLKNRPTAVFSVNNLAAVGLIQALQEMHLSVPADMALVCYDDIDLASMICPFLTVMAQPADSFGTIALQLLLDRIKGQVGEARIVSLSATFIIRKSCGAGR